MSEITFEISNDTHCDMQNLMRHYGCQNKAELFNKALSMLKVVAAIDKQKGELVARKGHHETILTF